MTRLIVSILALFGPYFAIPLTFQFAGGVLANLTGNASRWSKSIDRMAFGSKQDENSIRGLAERNKHHRKARRLGQAASAGEKMMGDRSKANPLRMAGWALNKEARRRSGDRLALYEADRFKQADEELRLLTGNGDDSLGQGFTGNGIHGWNLRDSLPEEANQQMKTRWGKLTRDKYGSAALVSYAIGKMNTENGVEELRKDFIDGVGSNEASNQRWAGVGANLSKDERMEAWDQAVNTAKTQQTNLSEKYKGADSGRIDGTSRTRFTQDMAGGKGVGAQYYQKASSYNDLSRIAMETGAEKTYAEQLATQQTGSTANWQDYLHQVGIENGQATSVNRGPMDSKQKESYKNDWQERSDNLKRSRRQLGDAQKLGRNPGSADATAARDRFNATMDGLNL